MVKLTETTEQPDRPVGLDFALRPGAHRRWGVRFGRNRDAYKTEPTGLLHLEALARRSVELMEKYNPKSDSNYHKAMDLLRLQYNLNFIVLCEKCGGPHDTDEIIAPER